ncbi:hypothetical protein CIHG_03765 [Coccidioides immitis H538.4]|uniref:Uncharacterized protein n=1 Tax=Coccidioides immitis H538.4 TaxID=396776 RepID=A0A0J8RKR6_COCIT|nr:hypothetical protein CIHG_03765 [Coccidioides immitis H538.4]
MVIEPSLLLFPENGSREWKALLHLKRPAVKRRWPIWLASGLSAGAASVRPMGIEEPARCQFLQVLFYCYYGELLAVKRTSTGIVLVWGLVRKGCVTSLVPLAGWLAGWLAAVERFAIQRRAAIWRGRAAHWRRAGSFGTIACREGEDRCERERVSHGRAL